MLAEHRVLRGPSAKHKPSASTETKRADSTADARAAYTEHLTSLGSARSALAKRLAATSTDGSRAAVLADARTTLLDAIEKQLFPAWIGTAWDFNGTTESPGEGHIACGYFVTTILRDAGFDVERARLAQQASELIVKTLAPASDVWRFRKGDTSLVLDKVHAEGEGLYVVGLDNHVGFLLERGSGPTRFCHASYLDPVSVQCEPAEDAAAFASNYHVVGRVTNDATLRRWIEGDAFATAAARR